MSKIIRLLTTSILIALKLFNIIPDISWVVVFFAYWARWIVLLSYYFWCGFLFPREDEIDTEICELLIEARKSNVLNEPIRIMATYGLIAFNLLGINMSWTIIFAPYWSSWILFPLLVIKERIANDWR